MISPFPAQIPAFLGRRDPSRQQQFHKIPGCNCDHKLRCQKPPDLCGGIRIPDHDQYRFVRGGNEDRQKCPHRYNPSGVKIRRHNRETALWNTAQQRACRRSCPPHLHEQLTCKCTRILFQDFDQHKCREQIRQHLHAVHAGVDKNLFHHTHPR